MANFPVQPIFKIGQEINKLIRFQKFFLLISSENSFKLSSTFLSLTTSVSRNFESTFYEIALHIDRVQRNNNVIT